MFMFRSIINNTYLISLAFFLLFLYPAQQAFLLQQVFPFLNGFPQVVLALTKSFVNCSGNIFMLLPEFHSGISSFFSKRHKIFALVIFVPAFGYEPVFHHF